MCAAAPDEVLTGARNPARAGDQRPGRPARTLVLALAAANLAPGDAAPGLLALNRAASVAEAGRAAPLITAPVQNLLVADRQGIGLFVTGRVPLRRAGDGSRPVPGADGSHDWTGFASGDALPHIVAPASGRLVNANERIAPPDFPGFLGRDWFDDARARRIRQLLDRPGLFAPADFAAMQADTVDLVARDLLPRLRRRRCARPGCPRGRSPCWGTGTAATAAGLPQPLIFNAWMQHLYHDILAARRRAAGCRGGGGALDHADPERADAGRRRAVRRRLRRAAARSRWSRQWLSWRRGSGPTPPPGAGERRTRRCSPTRCSRDPAAGAAHRGPHRRPRRRFHAVPRRHAAGLVRGGAWRLVPRRLRSRRPGAQPVRGGARPVRPRAEPARAAISCSAGTTAG